MSGAPPLTEWDITLKAHTSVEACTKILGRELKDREYIWIVRMQHKVERAREAMERNPRGPQYDKALTEYRHGDTK